MVIDQCASTGLGLNTLNSPMCVIDGKLNLPHRLNGIIIARNVRIFHNVAIFQNVAIAEEDKNKIIYIESGATLGANSIVLNNSRIGKNAFVGANAVVTHDVPAGGWSLEILQNFYDVSNFIMIAQ